MPLKSRLLVTVIAAVLTLTPSIANPVDAQDESIRKLAFAGWREGDYELFLINEDGSDLQQLTDNDWDDYMPSWSPDGRQIAFTSYPLGYSQLFVLNIDIPDSDQSTLLFEKPGNEPSWSPLGDKIAFTASADNVWDDDIYLVNLDGSGLTNLTNTPNSRDQAPAWSPDGTQITFRTTREREPFVRGQDLSYDGYIMNADGTNQRKLVSGGFELSPIAWSPDGNKIAYHIDTDTYHVYIANSDGTNPRLLLNSEWHGRNPAWSPNGEKLAFSIFSNRGGNLAFVSPDGSHLTIYLTSFKGDSSYPVWQPQNALDE